MTETARQMRRLSQVFWVGVAVFLCGVPLLALSGLLGSAVMSVGSVAFCLALLRGEDVTNG